MLSQSVRPFLLLCLFLAFQAFGNCQESNYETARVELKKFGIKDVKLVAWQAAGKRKKRVEVHEFLEAKRQHLLPADNFDVECEIVGGEDVLTDDYFLWTTVDFLVAPVTRAYEQMDNSALSSSVTWGQMTEMHDLKAMPIYLLRPGESRQVAVRGFDLNPVLAAFPVGEDGEL
ncbi:MAG TPA: hypothetical protein VJN89_03285 [Candidatus Acidoferrum sp.]|nr:hypothetical protein [Candidatus Acidoferrum sp.]